MTLSETGQELVASRRHMKSQITRRIFVNLWATAAGAAAAPALMARMTAAGTTAARDADASGRLRGAQSTGSAAENDRLQSEFLLDLVLDTQAAHTVGSIGLNRVIVPVSGGTFEGPKLKGTVVAPGGDWIVTRPDGSSVLDVRLVLQTDDAQNIYVTWRGISYTPQGGRQYARILPMFETGAAKYSWLNNVVTVGVHRPMPGKVAYHVYRIL
jgi:hypothetical protein